MSELITIARPYAKAAFDFAKEHHQILHWQQMLQVITAISKDPKVSCLFFSDIKATELAELFISVCEDMLDHHGQNFIRILAENKRLILLPQIFALFNIYHAQQEAIVDVNVISATRLASGQIEKITAAVERRLSCHIKITNKINESLICGFIIQAGDLVIDSSIKGRLERLTDVLQS